MHSELFQGNKAGIWASRGRKFTQSKVNTTSLYQSVERPSARLTFAHSFFAMQDPYGRIGSLADGGRTILDLSNGRSTCCSPRTGSERHE
jgi:hypothetical protein